MNVLAVFLVILSSYLHALKSFYIKKSKDKQTFLLLYIGLSQVVYFPLFLYFFLQHPPSLSSVMLWVTLTALVHFLYTVFFAKSYELGDLSLVYPIMRSAPALILIVAIIFLKEDISIRGASGILLILFGLHLVTLPYFSIKLLLKPFANLFNDLACQYALLTMLTVAAYSIIDKLAVAEIHPIVFCYMLSFSTFLLFSIYMIVFQHKTGFIEEWRHSKHAILINSIISQGGYLLILLAFTFERVAYVAGLRQLSILFAVFMGAKLLREDNRIMRSSAAVLIFIGAFLITIA